MYSVQQLQIQSTLGFETLDKAAALGLATATPLTDLRQYINRDHLVAIYSIQTLALAAALVLATSTPLTEGGRKTQW